jgi:tRNA threonylcarbamoyladenosine biosynthesis protein TsaB
MTALPPRRWLALDTSTERLCVAAGHAGRVAHLDVPGGAQASLALLPTARQVLADVGATLQDVQAIAFTRGPGAFTGLRGSVAVAQGLALAHALPVWPLDSLMLVAEDARAVRPVAEGQTVWVAMDARMDEVYAAAYRWRHGRWQVVVAPMLCDLETLAAHWAADAPLAVAGSALAAFGDRLPVGAARVLHAPHDRAAALARLAADAMSHQAGLDAAQALPLYLRDKVALTTAERTAEREARRPAVQPA